MYGANTTQALRGDYSHARADFTVETAAQDYSEAEHALWRRLYARQSELLSTHACREFAQGLAQTRCAERIPDLHQVSDLLEARSGWRLVAVPGLIPDEQFFRHLAARRFPVTIWLRKPEEFDYLVEPDIFHDFFGHVPMLFDPRFAGFLQRYGEQALLSMQAGALSMAARLYWYTVEFGLIEQDGELRAYGAGILSSSGETDHAVSSPTPRRVRFDIARCVRTLYRIDDFQKTYFVVRSLAELERAMEQGLLPVVERWLHAPTLSPDMLHPGDQIVPPRRIATAAC